MTPTNVFLPKNSFLKVPKLMYQILTKETVHSSSSSSVGFSPWNSSTFSENFKICSFQRQVSPFVTYQFKQLVDTKKTLLVTTFLFVNTVHRE